MYIQTHSRAVYTFHGCIYMKKLLTLRVEEAELERWKSIAAELNISLSAFIRGRCNTPEVAGEDTPSTPGKGLDTPSPLYKQLEAMDSAGELKDGSWRVKREPCKHGLLFCKKCK